MTGNDDGNRVLAVRSSHGTRAIRLSDSPCLLTITDGLAVGNVAERFPDLLLKGRALAGEEEVKRGQLTGEVGCQLLASGFEPSVVAHPALLRP